MVNQGKYDIDTQALLFGRYGYSISHPCDDFKVPEKFLADGFAVAKNIQSRELAIDYAQSLIASLFDSLNIPYHKLLSKVELMKADNIPVCKPFIEGNFQCLHFDYGFPILSDRAQNIYTLTILYFPYNSKQHKNVAATRIVPLHKLQQQKRWGSKKIVAKKLVQYTRIHGDGWLQPLPSTNTGRLASFARIIDALTNEKRFATDIETDSSAYFKNHPGGLTQLECEYKYYYQNGYDLKAIEEWVVLQEGDLLLIDNVRTIHGRNGYRNEKELFQAIFGIQKTKASQINFLRNNLLEYLSN